MISRYLSQICNIIIYFNLCNNSRKLTVPSYRFLQFEAKLCSQNSYSRFEFHIALKRLDLVVGRYRASVSPRERWVSGLKASDSSKKASLHFPILGWV